MLALCLMLLGTYYAQNCASIIGRKVLDDNYVRIILLDDNHICSSWNSYHPVVKFQR